MGWPLLTFSACPHLPIRSKGIDALGRLIQSRFGRTTIFVWALVARENVLLCLDVIRLDIFRL